MKRWMMGLLASLAIGIIVGAGYLGTQSVRGSVTAQVQPPQTVEVTRGDVQTTVTAPGHLVNTRETTLSFVVGGTLSELNVRAGQTVEAGEILARLDSAPLVDLVAAAQNDLALARELLDEVLAGPSEAQLAVAQLQVADAQVGLAQLLAQPSSAEVAAARAEVAAAEAELQRLRSLPDPDTVAQARARLDRATMVLQQAQAAYDKVQHRPNVAMLPQSLALQVATIDHDAARASLDAALRPPSPAALQAAEARLAAAQATLDHIEAGVSADDLSLARLRRARAEAELAQLLAGPTAQELRQAESGVRAADLALARAEANLHSAALTAPFDGVVLEASANPGEMVAAGHGVLRLAGDSALEVEATVIEEDLPLVRVGQEVILFFDAHPSAEVAGTVARIVPQRLPGDRPLYPVFITVDELPATLLAGMTVDASIVVASRKDVLRLPRALVRARSDGTATIRVWTGAAAVERSVRTGLRGDGYVEILEGLQAGDQVMAQ